MLRDLSFQIPQVRVLILHPNQTALLQYIVIALFNKRTPWSEASNFGQSHAGLQIIFQTVKTGYLLVHIPATHHCGRRCNIMGGGGGGLSVSDVKLTPDPGPSMNSV